MKLIEAKLTAITSLAFGTVLVGVLPILLSTHSRQQRPLLLSSLLCFGGGVLLATSIVHILPELRANIPQYEQYAEIIFCCGFFLLYIIDEIVHYFNDDHETNIHHPEMERRHSEGARYGATECDPLVLGERQPRYNPSFYRARSDGELLVGERPPSQLCHVGHQEPCTMGPVGNIGLLVALVIHASLEGLIVGLEPSSTKVLLLLGAIASHKLVVGFCLGVELASNTFNPTCLSIVYILMFALGSVGGIIGGMFISYLPHKATQMAIPILQGLAGGTLLYVTVSEVLPRERARWHKQNTRKLAGVLQFVSVGLGFFLMAALTLYLDYDK